MAESRNRERVLSVCSALAALFCAGRIFLLLWEEGKVYTMGIFPLALFAGLYCLWKRALFYEKLLFSVPPRVLLAFLFTALQVYGLMAAHPALTGSAEAFVWTVCFTPLTLAGVNMAFSKAVRLTEQGAEERNPAGTGREKKWFVSAFGVIFGGFCIPFAAFYPAIMAYDVIPQLDQIRSSGLTTHHPLVHTLFLAGCLKFGEAVPFFPNPDRAGLALYSLAQMAVLAGCFAYVYTFLRRHGVDRRLCYAFVLCAAFFPTHGMLAVSVTKDTVYGALVMVFTVFVWELSGARRCPGKGWLVGYGVLTLFLLLFRNNSVYAWILYAAVCLFAGRRNPLFRRISLFHGAVLLLYAAVSSLLVYASAATSDTYAREMLSVPAQQIARVVNLHEEELTARDRERLSTVWGEALPEYEPAIADRSKRDLTGDRETLETFMEEWISLGMRYPGEYIRAFLLKNKGMWDLADTTYLNVYSYAQGYLQITYPSDQQEYMEALAPGYVRHQRLQLLQSLYRYFASWQELWRYCPPLALVMQPAFYCFLLLFYCLVCIGLKRTQALLPAVYLLALGGTLLLGPCVLVRYLYPLMLSVSVLSLLLFGRGTGDPADTQSRWCLRR